MAEELLEDQAPLAGRQLHEGRPCHGGRLHYGGRQHCGDPQALGLVGMCLEGGSSRL